MRLIDPSFCLDLLKASHSIALAIVMLLIGLSTGYFISIESNTSTMTTSTSSLTSLSMSTTSSTSSGSSNSSYIGKVTYPPGLLQFLNLGMDGVAITGSKSQIDNLYNALFTPSFYFGNATHLSFSFQFTKNHYFERNMYGGDFNNQVLTYPTQVYIGTEGNLLLILAQIMNLYGSPYGNITSRGSNQLTIFMHSGNWTYGFGEENNMLPGTPLNESWALLDPSNTSTTIQNPEGYYVHAFQNFLTPNQTYWIGPFSTKYSGGNGTYNDQSTYNNTGYYWAGSLILGSYTQPLMTRYIYAINITRMLALSGIPTFECSGCSPMRILNLNMMFSLFADAPYGTPVYNGSFLDLHNLNDNYPGHDIYGPLRLSEYMPLAIEISGQSTSTVTFQQAV